VIYVLRCVVQPLIVFVGARNGSAATALNRSVGRANDVARLRDAATFALGEYGVDDPRYAEVRESLMRATMAADAPPEPEPEEDVPAEVEVISPRERLVQIFVERDSQKLLEVDSMLAECKDNEDELFRSLELNYYGKYSGPYYSNSSGASAEASELESTATMDATSLWNRQDRWFTCDRPTSHAYLACSVILSC
jgi:hypothetical protein